MTENTFAIERTQFGWTFCEYAASGYRMALATFRNPEAARDHARVWTSRSINS
jgi:hypothetical protein